MRDEIQAERDAENVALGESLMQCLADLYGCNPTETAIKRHVYKYTTCGAWIAFTEKGVKLGSIIEGSDAECTPIDVGYNGDDQAFLKAYHEALGSIESQAAELWEEANKE